MKIVELDADYETLGSLDHLNDDQETRDLTYLVLKNPYIFMTMPYLPINDEHF